MRTIRWAVLSLALLQGAAIAAPVEAMLKSKNCMACHSVDNKIVGPAFKAIAAKYKGDKNAVTLLAGKIQKGSVGVWGPVPMGPNMITGDEAKQLATWILAQK
ncbi:c-type cytochrome [Deefgea sp. CFH1-16]|nr:c-type cytochrome [Deefgea sp. CFH1-16]